MPPATRAEAMERLAAFLPRAGRDYQRQRNFDRGPGQHSSVSMLSAYIRHRIISEEEVLRAVLQEHSLRDAEKFVQEVFWRTYWKGWLEHRPSIWVKYLEALNSLRITFADEPGRRKDYERACEGRTGIEPFDAWVEELVSTGYLHNHARMWFASIWIFSLKLPWELGADFFLRHLLDGDPAANTLSWRWVAGLHTRGKTYLATPGNLEQYAGTRFFSDGPPPGLSRLTTRAEPMTEATPPTAIEPVFPESAPILQPSGLLLTEEDLLLDTTFTPDAIAIWIPASTQRLSIADQVCAFKQEAARDASQRALQKWPHCREPIILRRTQDITDWAAGCGLKQLHLAYLPQGYTRAELGELETLLAQENCSLERFVRDHDLFAWPYTRQGFFQLKKQIPDLLARLTPVGKKENS